MSACDTEKERHGIPGERPAGAERRGPGPAAGREGNSAAKAFTMRRGASRGGPEEVCRSVPGDARPEAVYEYDGSFAGLLTCIFDSYVRPEAPCAIRSADAPQERLERTVRIETDPHKAGRVRAGILRAMSGEGLELAEDAFRYGGAGKEDAILRLVRLGMRRGSAVLRMTGHPDVAPAWQMARAVNNEAHQYLGFVRFSEMGGVLAAVIEPKHFVLPKIAGHFCGRFPEERFLIHDRTHGAALLYQPYEHRIVEMRTLRLYAAGEWEDLYRRMWREYYRTAAVEGRENPRCRRTHMPKRFWPELSEMEPEEAALPGAERAGLLSEGRGRLPAAEGKLFFEAGGELRPGAGGEKLRR